MEKPKQTEKYYEAVGRRKTAIARVRLFSQNKDMKVNEKSPREYFKTAKNVQIVEAPLALMKLLDNFSATVKVSGSGLNSQAGAVRHGIARALVKFNPDFRQQLRQAGFLTRDPRMVERKKFGLKKARRAPQWSKR